MRSFLAFGIGCCVIMSGSGALADGPPGRKRRRRLDRPSAMSDELDNKLSRAGEAVQGGMTAAKLKNPRPQGLCVRLPGKSLSSPLDASKPAAASASGAADAGGAPRSQKECMFLCGSIYGVTPSDIDPGQTVEWEYGGEGPSRFGKGRR